MTRKIKRVAGKRFVGQRVAVSYNRHECLVNHPAKPKEHCFPVRAKPTSSSKVLGYIDDLWLEDVQFFVSPSGLRWMKKVGERTPVAFVVGTVLSPRSAKARKKSGWFQVRFEPFEHGCFFDARNDACLKSAKFAYLGKRKIEAFGAQRGPSVGSMRQLNPAPDEIPLVTPERPVWHGEMGGLNYGPATAEALSVGLRDVWRRWPGAVVLDGTDDWEAPPHMQTEFVVEELSVESLAIWHTGKSGVSSTGVVLRPEELQRVRAQYAVHFGFPLPVDRRQVPVPECGCWDGRGFRIYPDPGTARALRLASRISR